MEEKSITLRKFIYLILLIIGVWILTWIITDYFIIDPSDRGSFGDKFGSINSLFSGLAFATLIYTILLQREEIKLQRKDIKIQIDELVRSTDEMVAQTKLQRHQRFENKFFQLITLFQKLVNSLQYEGNHIQGVIVFKKLYIAKLVHFYKVHGDITVSVHFTYQENKEILSHYFEFLRHILVFIETTEEIGTYERKQYADILKSQLSAYEIIFLFYYYSSELIDSKYKALLLKYWIIENVDNSLLLDTEHQSLITELQRNLYKDLND